MKALIDGDIVLHRCAWASDNDSEDIALIRTDGMIREILNDTESTEYEVWISDVKENNFRYEIDPTYKANRVQPRPRHYDAIKEFLFNEWNAHLALGQEADDSLGIRQVYQTANWFEIPSIICSIDKDLLQIPGRHYNFVKKEFRTVEYLDGIKMFWKQMLIGDVADNIKGVDKIGPVKSEKIIGPLNSESAMYNIVRNYYLNDDERLLKNGRLLWIRREEDQVWTPPNLLKDIPIVPEPEAKPSSTAQ